MGGKRGSKKTSRMRIGDGHSWRTGGVGLLIGRPWRAEVEFLCHGAERIVAVIGLLLTCGVHRHPTRFAHHYQWSWISSSWDSSETELCRHEGTTTTCFLVHDLVPSSPNRAPPLPLSLIPTTPPSYGSWIFTTTLL